MTERHIKNKDKLYAIFTPRQNLVNSIVMRNPTVEETPGEDTVWCHIMLKVSVNVFLKHINAYISPVAINT